MFGNEPIRDTNRVTFILIPDYSMMAFTSALEPLRAANRLAEKRLYSWRILSPNGEPARASNGVVIQPEGSLSDAPLTDATLGTPIVCAGINADRFCDQTTFNWLRARARHGTPLGALCTGSLILARAGLLDGYRCTIHWENIEGFVEEFPHLDITATLFEIDRDRYTCAGGTASLDMMVYAISLDYGDELALNVSEQMLHGVQRHPHDTQRLSLRHRAGSSNPKLLSAIAYMEAYLEKPLSMQELAAWAELSERQLERLFKTHLKKTPSRYYLELRLTRARLLLQQTTMPLLQVAVACGFTSASHFAKVYRQFFGRAPRLDRAHGQSQISLS